MKRLFVAFALLLVACSPEPSMRKMHEATVSLASDGHTVHILVPCATLTPSTDYRDFMERGTTVSSADGVLLGHDATYVDPDKVLPPAEATLVFDNSEGCN